MKKCEKGDCPQFHIDNWQKCGKGDCPQFHIKYVSLQKLIVLDNEIDSFCVYGCGGDGDYAVGMYLFKENSLFPEY